MGARVLVPFGEFVVDHGETEPELGQRLFDVGLLPFEDNVFDFAKLARTERAIATVYETIAKSDRPKANATPR